MDGYIISPDLLFLFNWNSFSREEKIKKYTNYFCHETHVFLYFKDKPFFDEVVRPFIVNKLEKSLIDHWLLGNYDEIEKYTSVEFFDNLNSVEKILLIYIVAQKGDATPLVERIKLNSESVEANVEYRNVCFDAVINAHHSEMDEGTKMEVDYSQVCEEEEKSGHSIPLAAEVRSTPPLSPAYMYSQNLTQGYQEQSRNHSIQSKRKTRTRQTARKSTGGKGLQGRSNLKRTRKIEESNSRTESDEIGVMFNEDEDENKKIRTSFQPMELPSEYCETHYYSCISINKPDLVLDNKYWLDLANHLLEKKNFEGFLSGNFILVTSNISEIIFSNAFLDLPFESKNNLVSKLEGDRSLKFNISSPSLLFIKEIKRAKAEIGSQIHIIHRFFEFGNEHTEKKLTCFLTHQVYGCEVIITNVSSKKQSFQLLWQIPEGALPLQNINYQKSENHNLEPYSTTTFSYYFYFPYEGEFTQFPSNVSVKGTVVAVSKIAKFKVVKELEQLEVDTFKDILMTGDNQKVYEFLRTSNLLQDKKGFSFELIYWMLRDKTAFQEIIGILRERKIYVHTIWQFGFFHNDAQAVKEYISRSEYLCNIVGSNFKSSLYNNYLTMHKPRHLEYFPLVNARVHNLGNDSCFRIANNEFKRQYDAFLMHVISKNELDASDYLCYAYFLLLQERISEGIDMFSKIDPQTLTTNGSLVLQYDYMAAYLDFYTGEHSNFKVAREISDKYADYPVLHWRVLFEEIRDQLKEFDGDMDIGKEINQNEDDKKMNLKISKELEPLLFAELKGKRIQVDYENIDSVDIKYYMIDPEILFSRTPFLMQDTEDFAFVKPIQTFTVYLNTSQKTELIDIESSLLTSNMIIEVQGQGKQEFLRYFSTSLKLIINENYGELKVTNNEDKPLPLVYIKVFSRNKDGEVKFFRDGYTDINGKYEYAQINSKSITDVERFAIFVSSEEHGSMTKETPPPLAIEQNEIDSWQANSLKINKRIKKSTFSKPNQS